MKDLVSSYIKTHIKQILLGLYTGTIINIYIYLTIMPNDELSILNKILLTLSSLLIYLLTYYLSAFLINTTKKIKIKNQKSTPRKKYFIVFILCFSLCMLVGLIWFIAYAPGAFSSDSIGQYSQAITNNYNDWHPVLHTLLVFKIPISIFGNIQSVVICQIIFFSLSIAYSAATIYSIAGRKWSLAFLAIIVSNPIVFDELMYPWKDVSFAILALLISTATLKICYFRSSWTKKPLNLILLGTALAFCTIIRHNGLLFTVPVLVFTYLFICRTQWIKLFCIFLGVIFIVKVPLYSTLQVATPGKRTTETVGLPITIIANVAKNTPWSMDEELSSFVYDMAPSEIWQNSYATGDFNSVKFTSINLDAIEKFNPAQIFLMATKATIKSPTASLTAAFKLTYVVYGIGDIPSYEVIPVVQDNNLGIEYSGNEALQKAITSYRKVHNQSILKYFGFCGFTIFVIILFIISKNSRKDWRKILLCTPILFYDFGTMILLTGPETRFFYVNFVVYPVIVVLATKSISPKAKKA